MKITIRNYELENYFTGVLAEKDCFIKNTSIKLPGEMGWNLRLNLKTLNDRYAIFQEARNEIGQAYVDAGKTEGDMVKPEYAEEYSAAILDLFNQSNELEILPLKKEDVINLAVSMPEQDFLALMIAPEEA